MKAFSIVAAQVCIALPISAGLGLSPVLGGVLAFGIAAFLMSIDCIVKEK